MLKKRKTRREKVHSRQRQENEAFKIKEEWLGDTHKIPDLSNKYLFSGTKFLRRDLTKTFVLTMLVLALELALWLYLSRH